MNKLSSSTSWICSTAN